MSCSDLTKWVGTILIVQGLVTRARCHTDYILDSATQLALHSWYETVMRYQVDDKVCHPGGHYWHHSPGALSFKSSHCNSFQVQVPVDFIFKLIDWKIGHQDNSSSNGHQGGMPYWFYYTHPYYIHGVEQWTVWYKTKFGSQNFVQNRQIWVVYCSPIENGSIQL